MRRPARPLPLVLVTAAATVVLAACGGGPSSSTADGGTPAPPSAAAAAATSAASSTQPSSAGPGASSQPASSQPASTQPASTQPTATVSTPPTTAPTATLPDGSTTILPGHRVVALYGASVTPPDDALGDAGSPASAANEVMEKAAAYSAGGEPVLGAFELISTIIQAAPGPHGDHAADIELSEVQKYETEALKDHLLLILDIQPGTSHYLPHIQRLGSILKEPNVSIALDPEWQFLTGGYQDATGSSPASEINAVSAYLSAFVAQNHLPQKLFVLHQFTKDMITDRGEVKDEPGLATVMHIDGIGDDSSGGNAAKIADYKVLHGGPGQFSGFKLFLKEDSTLMTPAQVLALKPAPDLVTYQ